MMDVFVDVTVKVSAFASLLHHIAALPKPFRPTYFTVGERVRNKKISRVDDVERFSAFVDDHVRRVSGCDLIGEKIRYGFFVGATRTGKHQSTHVGCSVILRGPRWQPADFESLLRQLCASSGVERGDACMRDEWTHRHVCVKKLERMSIEGSLGVDMSAQLPGLYWWTAISEELAQRHRLDREELTSFVGHSESWSTQNGSPLHAFRLYEAPQDWREQDERVSTFLRQHPNFFSMARIQPMIDVTQTKEEFDAVVRPYLAGALPWEAEPKHV